MREGKLLDCRLHNSTLLQDSKQGLLVSEILNCLYLLLMEFFINILLMQVNMFQKSASKLFNFLQIFRGFVYLHLHVVLPDNFVRKLLKRVLNLLVLLTGLLINLDNSVLGRVVIV